MIKMNSASIVVLQKMLIERTGGKFGIANVEVFDAVAAAPEQKFAGQELYPSATEKAARLCVSLIVNKPFVDGNRRMGILALLAILECNDIKLAYSKPDLVLLAKQIEAGMIKHYDLVNWIHQRMFFKKKTTPKKPRGKTEKTACVADGKC